MRRLLILALAGLVLGLGGCKKEEAEEEPAPPAANRTQSPPQPASQAARSSAPAQAPAENRAPAVPRKLIRTVDLQLEVKDSAAVARQVEVLVTRMGGYVSASNTQRVGGLLEYTMTVRVPVDRFDPVLNGIRAFAVRIDREHQAVEDVTDQYIDLDARRRTLEATETELRGLLAEARQRGRKVGEIMEIYKQLVDIRSQIEEIQGKLNSYDKLAAFSTINLELIPTEAAKPVAGTGWHPSDTLRSSFRTLVGFLQWLVDFVIYVVVVLLPVGLVIAVALLLFLWIRRRIRRVTVGEPPPGEGPAAP